MDQNIANRNVEGIYISPARGDSAVSTERIHFVPGIGIKANRSLYLDAEIVPLDITNYVLTLVEIRVIEAVCQQESYYEPQRRHLNS
jgi:hypothetical protein